MKVMHVLYDNIYSGAQNVVCQIVDLFKTYSPNMEMVYVSPDGPIREALREHAVQFHAVESLSIGNLKKVIQEEKPDLIHAHDMRASVITALASGSIPIISHIHNNNFNSRQVSVKSLTYCYAAIKAKHIFWVSKSSFDGFVFGKVFETKSSVLYNVIDRDKVWNYASVAELQNSYDIVYVGRLTYQKNPCRLIRVFSRVAKIKNDATMAIIGTGELEGDVRKLISQLPKEIRDRITVCGYLNNPYGVMKNAKIMLMTSRWEGTPMCVLEAMELGVPLVSTPSDGIADVVRNGENGYLEESDEKLAERCVELLTDSERWKKMFEAARNFSRNYNDGKAFFDRIDREYQTALRIKE